MKICFPTILEECEQFQDNKINDDGDFIHFTLMAKSESVKTEEALSIPKWICAMKEGLESIDKNKTWELIGLLEEKKPVGGKMGVQSEGKSQG